MMDNEGLLYSCNSDICFNSKLRTQKVKKVIQNDRTEYIKNILVNMNFYNFKFGNLDTVTAIPFKV